MKADMLWTVHRRAAERRKGGRVSRSQKLRCGCKQSLAAAVKRGVMERPAGGAPKHVTLGNNVLHESIKQVRGILWAEERRRERRR